METTPETAALFAELFERCGAVDELDGPQIEAFVSGLLPMFDDEQASAAAFVAHCRSNPGPVAVLVCAALAELVRVDDPELAASAGAVVDEVVAETGVVATQEQVGASELSGAWTVTAPFGRSVIVGFSNPVASAVAAAAAADVEVPEGEIDEAGVEDGRHSLLVELAPDGALVDLQLSGAAELMIDDVGSVDSRVLVEPVSLEEGLALIVDAWPNAGSTIASPGPGIAANQQFVRSRMHRATGRLLPAIMMSQPVVDVQRGLDDSEFADANRAALSTLQAALGDLDHAGDTSVNTAAHQAWIGVVRGDGGELSGRERDALIWLEWADWLGAAIGLARAGPDAAVSGGSLVDYVNRCPEVSSVIDKADRDYAEWAFSVAIDVLEDAGVVADERLTTDGFEALVPALVHAWT